MHTIPKCRVLSLANKKIQNLNTLIIIRHNLEISSAFGLSTLVYFRIVIISLVITRDSWHISKCKVQKFCTRSKVEPPIT